MGQRGIVLMVTPTSRLSTFFYPIRTCVQRGLFRIHHGYAELTAGSCTHSHFGYILYATTLLGLIYGRSRHYGSIGLLLIQLLCTALGYTLLYTGRPFILSVTSRHQIDAPTPFRLVCISSHAHEQRGLLYSCYYV